MSQNYTNFRMEKPSGAIWDEVAKMCPPEPEWCCLFASDCPAAAINAKATTNWSTIEPPK